MILRVKKVILLDDENTIFAAIYDDDESRLMSKDLIIK